jgi:endonuclease YncB( thermonuclease family)
MLPIHVSKDAPMRIFVFWLLWYWLLATAGLAASFTGQVVNVSDGDTLVVLRDGNVQEKVRLAEIDCPEKNQPFGQAAKRFTTNQAARKVVIVEVRDRDRYGRTVGEILFPDGKSLNRELVKAGYAWWYRKYSTDESFGELERQAQVARKGLWADRNPVPPWEWRRDLKR